MEVRGGLATSAPSIQKAVCIRSVARQLNIMTWLKRRACSSTSGSLLVVLWLLPAEKKSPHRRRVDEWRSAAFAGVDESRGRYQSDVLLTVSTTPANLRSEISARSANHLARLFNTGKLYLFSCAQAGKSFSAAFRQLKGYYPLPKNILRHAWYDHGAPEELSWHNFTSAPH